VVGKSVQEAHDCVSEYGVRKSLVNELIQNITNTSGQALLRVNAEFQAMVTSIRKGLMSAIDGTKAFFKDLPERVKEKTLELYTSVVEQSSKIWKALKGGAKDTVAIIKAGFATVLKRLGDAFETASHHIGKGKAALLAETIKIKIRADRFAGSVRKMAGKAVSKLQGRPAKGSSRDRW
jgi:hypothetical protein